MRFSGARSPQESGYGFVYDAFLSYCRHDRPVAESIQKGLHRIGRRVGRLHALRVFRDTTDIGANPDLWGRVTDALDQSRYLIVVLSVKTRESRWVNREVDYWLINRGPRNLMFVVADGDLVWDADAARFDPRSTAALPALTEPGALPTEPSYVDVSADGPWDLGSPMFRDKVTDLAAPIHGKSKYDLAGDDIRELRRYRWLRRAAVSGLAVLTVLAVIAAGIAINQRGEAIRQRNDAEARRLVAEAQAMLAGTQAGGDARAFKEILSAYALSPESATAQLRDVINQRRTTSKIATTGVGETCVSYSPDGRLIASGATDGTIRLFDAESGERLLEPLTGHREWVNAVIFSPDGRRLASAGSDGTVRLWETDTGHPIGIPLLGHRGPVGDVAFSPDGHLIATAGFDKSIRLWKVDEGQPVGAPLIGHSDEVRSVAFSPDGGRLVSASNDSTVRIWDVRTGQMIGEPLTGHRGWVTTVAFSPDGREMASAGQDTEIRLWNAESGTEIGEPLKGHADSVAGLAFSHDGQVLASASFDKSIRLWDIETGDSTTTLRGHGDSVYGVSFSADGTRLVSSSADGTIRIWGLSEGQPFRTGFVSAANATTFSPDGRLLAVAGDATVQLWNLNSPNPIQSITGHTDSIFSVAFSPDGHRVASGSGDRTVRLWNADTGRPQGALEGHTDFVEVVSYSPDGSRLASASRDGTVRFWNPNTGLPVGAPLPAGTIGSLRGAPPDWVVSMAFSPDGHRLATVSQPLPVAGGAMPDSYVQIWDVESGRRIGDRMVGHSGAIFWVAYSPTGDRLATAGIDRTIRLWNGATGSAEGRPLTGHTDSVYRVTFSPDGRLLASGGADGTARLWDVASGQSVGAPLIGHTDALDGVAFSPDGGLLATASLDRTVRVWPVAVNPEMLCDKLTSNISEVEWRQWVSASIGYLDLCPELPDDG